VKREIDLGDREIVQVLAALRNWQIDTLNEDLNSDYAQHFGGLEPLTDEEIEDLCERLNPDMEVDHA
jgi:hypothetical protein